MANIKNSTEIQGAIQLLKQKQHIEFELLIQQFQVISESITPKNIIKNALDDIVNNQAIKSNLIDAALVLGTNYIIKKIAPKKSGNWLSTILGSFVEFSLLKYAEKDKA